MVQAQTAIDNVKLSTVASARATASGVTHQPTWLDLAMKLHYLKALYIFSPRAALGVTTMRIKEAVFPWFNKIYWTCGRFRRSDSGRPYIKCNDCGARFVEGTCDMTVDEWLSLPDRSVDEMLVYHRPVGPELQFSPLVYIQVTQFKCGGMSLGLSWNHVLGDPFSLSNRLNELGDFMAGLQLGIPSTGGKPSNQDQEAGKQNQLEKEPISLKRVGPVGDLWVIPNKTKTATFSFHLTAPQLSVIQAKVSGNNNIRIPLFESLCAIIWKCIARVRQDSDPRIVTICKRDPRDSKTTKILSNNQVLSSVQANFDVSEADLEELGKLLLEQASHETSRINKAVESDNGVSDFIVYGARLTFVDMDGADLYGLKLNGRMPEFVYYNIQGVGDEGAVVVLPEPKGFGKGSDDGRFVTVTLPEEEVVKLKSELESNCILLENDL